MRKLVVLVVIAAALWSGYWLVGARAVETALRGWLDARAAEGWVADYRSVDTRGFPNRFDTTITGLDLADPRNGIAWSAPFFQILALSYKPNHVIAVWPETQSVTTPDARIEVAAEQMRGSVIFEAGTALVLERSTFVLDAARLTSSAGWSAAIAEGRLATRQTAAREFAHDIGIEATGIAPSEALLAAVDAGGTLPARIDRVKIDATLAFDGPWDRFALGARRPALTALELKELIGRWGGLELRASGALKVDDRGVPEGRIALEARGWRQMLALAIEAGAIPPQLAPTVERGLEILARLSGSDDTLKAPLSFQNGFVSFGPVPLGPAPRLALR